MDFENYLLEFCAINDLHLEMSYNEPLAISTIKIKRRDKDFSCIYKLADFRPNDINVSVETDSALFFKDVAKKLKIKNIIIKENNNDR